MILNRSSTNFSVRKKLQLWVLNNGLSIKKSTLLYNLLLFLILVAPVGSQEKLVDFIGFHIWVYIIYTVHKKVRIHRYRLLKIHSINLNYTALFYDLSTFLVSLFYFFFLKTTMKIKKLLFKVATKTSLLLISFILIKLYIYNFSSEGIFL